jgi:ubiquinone/menaquinone biosynthesis C-methylase UbiE
MLEQEIKRIWEVDADHYDALVKNALHDDRHLTNAWAEMILSWAPRGGQLDILDCGTGPGFLTISLAEQGHHVTGIDISENMIEKASENVRNAKVNAELFVMDCQETAFPEESFDLVVSRAVTWTLSDPPKAYKEWKRLLKKGGRLIILDANVFLHLYDEERKTRFEQLDRRAKQERGHGIFSRGDEEDFFKSIKKDLFMSSKNRPLWDLGYLMEIGFSNVFAIPNIRGMVPDAANEDDINRKLSDLRPMFIVGAQK